VSEALSIDPPASFGKILMNIRTSLQLIQSEVAECFGITAREEFLFERVLPVGHDVKIKILR
jgi:hypothetical protein